MCVPAWYLFSTSLCHSLVLPVLHSTTNILYRNLHSYMFLFFISSTMYSLVRIDNARIVQVMFLSACETNGPPSTQNRFLTSCDWLHLFKTDVLGSSPILTEPASWMICPGLCKPQLFSGPSSPPEVMTAPMLWRISAKVSFMCFACLI